MFQFTRFATLSLWIQPRVSRLSLLGYPIRKSTDLGLLAAPRGFSQLPTSFIASRRQGIHRAPLVAFPYPKARIDDSRPGFVARTLVASYAHCSWPHHLRLQRLLSYIFSFQRTDLRSIASFIRTNSGSTLGSC
jgi:hypothetical protein